MTLSNVCNLANIYWILFRTAFQWLSPQTKHISMRAIITADIGQLKAIPTKLHQKPMLSQKFTMWCSLSKVGKLGSCLLKMSVDRRWRGIKSHMGPCFRTFLFLTWMKMSGIFQMSSFNRMKPQLIPREFQWMLFVKYLIDNQEWWHSVDPHSLHLIVATATSS